MTTPIPPTYIDFDDFAKNPPAKGMWSFSKSRYNAADDLRYTLTFITTFECSYGKDVEPVEHTFRFHIHAQADGDSLEWAFGGLWIDGLRGNHLIGEELNHDDYPKMTAIAEKLLLESYDNVVHYHQQIPRHQRRVVEDYKSKTKGEEWQP